MAEVFEKSRSRWFEKQETANFLGSGSRIMYTFVRQTLNVPLHQGLTDHPEPQDVSTAHGSKKRTIGSNISIIYEALRSGKLHEPLMQCLETEANTARADSLTDLNFEKRNTFSNGTTSGPPAEKHQQEVEARNGQKAFSAESKTVAPEPIIIQAKRRHSISLGENNHAKRRPSLAAVQGSLTGM
ncbi:MAG: hypothetical protein Q9220_006978 [cf. Caloplaca sp. 1 TL-2023]